MIEIFETCQTKSIAKQTNRDESLIIRSIAGMQFFVLTAEDTGFTGRLKRGIDGTNFEYLRASYLYPP